MTGTTQHVLELFERIQELEQERDSLIEFRDALIAVAKRFANKRNAALERERVLKDSVKAFLSFRGLICGPEYHALILGLNQASSGTSQTH